MNKLSNAFYYHLKLSFLLMILFSVVSNHLKAQSVMQTVFGNTSGPGGWFFGPIMRSGPNTNTLNHSRHAYLYTAAELNIPPGSKIIRLEWMKKDTGQVIGNNNFNVWVSNTTATSFPVSISWSNLVAGATQEYASTTYSVLGGANTYLQAPFIDSFTYSGGSLQILTDWTKLGFATAAVPFYTLTAAGKSIGIASASPLTGASLLQTSIYGGSRPTMRITYVTVPSCSGTPNPGNTLSTATSVCPGVPFTLSIQNQIAGSLLTYQWQSADNAAFTLNFAGNIGTSASLNTSQNSGKYYRCIVTCGIGPTSGISTPIFMPMSPSYSCYCDSRPISDADEDITKFTLGNLKNCSDCSSVAPGSGSLKNIYSNYKSSPPANVQVGAIIPFTIDIGVCGSGNYANTCAIFIDYNQNMSFADPGELVYSSASATVGPHIESGNIMIPINASIGLTGVRVINAEQNGSITSPCLLYSYGETEDYLINIAASTACTGMPAPGNTIASAASSCTTISGTFAVCSGSSVHLTIQNIPTSTGISYQWFNSLGPIAGATNALYISTPITSNQSFYCNVTCNNSGSTASSVPITITLSSFLQCYCSSMAASVSDEEIHIFSFGSGSNISSCDTVAPGPGSVLNRYSNFTTLGNLATVQLGSAVPFLIDVIDCDVPPEPYYSFATAVWIDFNHNGSFSDAGEQVFAELTVLIGPRIITGNINIPCTAMQGQTRIRVSAIEGLAGINLLPCLIYGYGETEDYLINIVQPTLCTSPVPSPGNTESSVSILCDSTIVDLSLQNKCLLSNYSFQWFKNGVLIPGATNSTYTTPKIFATTTYHSKVSCGLSNALSNAVTITKPTINNVTLNASSSNYCIPGGNPVTLTASGSVNYSYTPNSSLSPSSGSAVSATPSTSTIYTVTGTDANGCTRTSTASVQVIPCSTNFNLKLFIEGFYIGSGLMIPALFNQGVGNNTTVTDSITVELHSALSPYGLIDSKKVVLQTNGMASINFPSLSNSYYIVIKHRNALETWSSAPVAGSVGFYDFTTSDTKAFGSNMNQMETNVWALYSGDLMKDNNVDLLDINIVENDINLFLFGYTPSDINGDGNVDLLDIIPVEINVSNFIYGIFP